MTAGEAIRRELDAGSSALGLAKRLAASDDDADPEVKKWRYVVMRAARGGEPSAANALRIGQVFNIGFEEPRRVRPEEVAAERYARILENQLEALKTQDEILAELRALRKALESPARAGSIAPTQSQ